MTVAAIAATVTLAWDPSPSTDVNGYRIYYGNATRAYTNAVPVNGAQNTNCTVSNLLVGLTYYFAATATATNGLESDFSNEVSYQVPSTPIPVPQGLRIVHFGM